MCGVGPDVSGRVVGIYYYKRKGVARDFLYIFTNVTKFLILFFVHYADSARDMKRKKGVERINV